MKGLCFVLFNVAILVTFATFLSAQTNQGALSGNIVDETGALVTGATVRVTSQATGAHYEATSTEGGYRFPSLPIGLYDLIVEHAGFTTAKNMGVRVQVGSTTSVNVALQIAGVAQNVTVTAEAAVAVKQDTSDIGTVINTRQVVELPLALGGVGALRSPEAFKFLAPGTAGPGTSNSSNGIWISKINGGQAFGDELLLDGASILRTENGSSFDEAAPSVEAIQEFKIFTSSFSAQYDRTTGGVTTFLTKSGTNQYHGTAYDIFRNTVLNANTWFNSGYRAKCASGDADCRSRYATPPDRKNDYGLNLGGPVRIPKVYNGANKSFFFFNWEQYLQNVGGTYTSTVPTLAQRGGDFSGLVTSAQIGTNPCDGSPVFSGQIFDPASQRIGPTGLPCRSVFPGNIVPANRISQVAKNILAYLPNPTASGTTQNYAQSDANPLANTVWTLRVDQYFSEKSRIFAMYSGRDNTRRTSGRAYPGVADSNGWNQDFITHYFRGGWDYTFSPALLNHFNVGFNRTNSLNYSDGAIVGRAQNVDWDAKLGIKGASGDNFPTVNFGEGIRAMSRGNDDDEIDNGWRFNDSIMWIKGRHSFTFGADVRRQLYSTIRQSTQAGVLNFARNQTAASQVLSSTSGNGFASFLLGAVNSGTIYLLSHYPRWLHGYYAGFVQDDFKISQTLTLNLGFRYNLDVPRVESYNNTSNFSPTAPNPAAGNRPGALIFGTTCNCNARWAETYKKAISPRFGFAWAPAAFKTRTVFRGGYGIFYGPLQYTDSGSQMMQGWLGTPNFFNTDNFTPGFALDSGYPYFAPPPTLDPSYVNGSNPYYIAPNYGRVSMTQSWSLQIQQQLGTDLIVTAGYTGQRSTHLRSALLNMNNMGVQYFALGDTLNAGVTSTAAQSASVAVPYAGFTGNVSQALRPYPQFGRIITTVLENVGQSSYHSLQATVERRFHAGLSLQGSFTWAKTLTDADSLMPGLYTGLTQNQNPNNLDLDKAVSLQSIPLMGTFAWIYELPFGPGRKWVNHGFAGVLAGGWQIGGVQRYQSGAPVSFGCATAIPGWDNCVRFSRGDGQSIYSQQVLNGAFDPFVNRYYNPAAFVDPNANRRGGAYQFGNYPRVSEDARMTPYYNEDFSVVKNIPLPRLEAARLQFKAEFLNAFNRHVFASPDTSPYSPTFGLVTGTVDSPRNIQFTLRLNF